MRHVAITLLFLVPTAGCDKRADEVSEHDRRPSWWFFGGGRSGHRIDVEPATPRCGQAFQIRAVYIERTRQLQNLPAARLEVRIAIYPEGAASDAEPLRARTTAGNDTFDAPEAFKSCWWKIGDTCTIHPPYHWYRIFEPGDYEWRVSFNPRNLADDWREVFTQPLEIAADSDSGRPRSGDASSDR